MSKITFSITSARGTATVEIHDASNSSASSILLGNSFKNPWTVTTRTAQNFSGGVVYSGRLTEGSIRWVGVKALVSEADYLLLQAIAVKSDKGRRTSGTVAVTMTDEFHKIVEDEASNTRAIAAGGVNQIGSTGSIWYYPSYDVIISNLVYEEGNKVRNGELAIEISFDIEELSKKTP